MKLKFASTIGCLFFFASVGLADDTGAPAGRSVAATQYIAQVPSPDSAAADTDVVAEIEEMVTEFKVSPNVSEQGCTSAQVAFGQNPCHRPTMNQYTSPAFSYHIWAGYPAQKARAEMLRDQLIFSPCPGGMCCRKPLSGLSANAHCVNGLSGCANGCKSGACGIGGYGTAGCATGACAPLHPRLGLRKADCGKGSCAPADQSCDLSAAAAQQKPVLPLAAFNADDDQTE